MQACFYQLELVKRISRTQVSRPAAEIVEAVMLEMTSSNDVGLPKPDLLTRAANLHRQNLRPKDPVDLDFQLDLDFLGADFVVHDLRVDDQRHVVMATSAQLQQLRQCRRWFIDGTFKLVKRPFYQLMSVHTFVRKGDDAKQVPLAFILMSRRMKRDYVEILECLKNHLHDCQVEWVMLDFEAGAWQALREVFPRATLKGCVFHWTQRVYRRVIQEGLATAYLTKGDKYLFLRKLMSLPYLPPEHIPAAFQNLADQAAEVGGPVERVVQYVARTWITNSMCTPKNWSVFRQPVRTNNDVEGWHRRINTRAGRADLGLYVLVPLLRREAEIVDLQIRLMSEHLLTRIHRKRYQEVHGRLFNAWDKYEGDELTTTQLLREAANLAGLAPTTPTDDVHDD